MRGKKLTVKRLRGKIQEMRLFLFIIVCAAALSLFVSITFSAETLTEGFNIHEPLCIDGSTSADYFKEAKNSDLPFAFKFLKPKKDVQWMETPMQHLGKTPPERWAKVQGKYCYTELPSSLFLYEPVDSLDAAKEWIQFLHAYEFLVDSKKSYEAILNRIRKKFPGAIKRKDFPPAYGMKAKKNFDGSFRVTILTLSHNKISYVEYTFTKGTFSDKSALFVDGPYLTMNMISLPPNFVMPPEQAKIEADEFEFKKLIKDVKLKEIKYTW